MEGLTINQTANPSRPNMRTITNQRAPELPLLLASRKTQIAAIMDINTHAAAMYMTIMTFLSSYK
jgi:hypothetical protein